MTIKLDSTKISTVVLCDHCPWWHGFADDEDEGWRVGARHEQLAHGEVGNAAKALANRRNYARRAERKRNSTRIQ